MARIPLVTRDQIAEKEQAAFDAFMVSRANRPNIGPYSLLLHMPEMAHDSKRSGPTFVTRPACRRSSRNWS